MISIDHSSPNDMDRWMRLVQKVSSSFPGLETEEALAGYRQTVLGFMARQEAIFAREEGIIVGVLLFSKENNMLRFLAGNVNCPCKKTKCERHGNCDACRAYHTRSKRKRPCERVKNNQIGNTGGACT